MNYMNEEVTNLEVYGIALYQYNLFPFEYQKIFLRKFEDFLDKPSYNET